MIAAILDTNVIVSATISPKGASSRVLDGYRDGAFRLAFSSETLDEVLHVLSIPSIQRRHGVLARSSSGIEGAGFVRDLLCCFRSRQQGRG